MVFEHQGEHPSQWKAIESTSAKLSIKDVAAVGPSGRSETDARARPGLTTDERAWMRELEREVKELRRASEILKAAAHFFGRSSTASHRGDRFHRRPPGPFRGGADLSGAQRHGCKIAPNTYWVAPPPAPSRRACRDAELVVKIRRV